MEEKTGGATSGEFTKLEWLCNQRLNPDTEEDHSANGGKVSK